ncbi:UNVERIFIED_CONTAM: Mitochondrial phosphate carrier protein 3, mitochondrial [Sesamum latifolium]|uniref:Mitochondrial phosphate carrier protein 3, mitochondrial n=1 Tax=Sesamum latifolium TaxID=2727402 RepID=A0AAW2XA50_9LAMI
MIEDEGQGGPRQGMSITVNLEIGPEVPFILALRSSVRINNAHVLSPITSLHFTFFRCEHKARASNICGRSRLLSAPPPPTSLLSDILKMALSSDRQSLIPNFLYSTSFTSKTLPLHNMAGHSNPRVTPSPSPSAPKSNFLIPAPSEPGKIEMFSPQYYAACTVGGILSCGLTHMAVTPLDLVKCNMQIDPAKYKSISSGFGVLLKEQGVKGFFRGWVPTLLGYSAQGACKFGFYEFFKKYYSDLAGPENASKYKTLIYLAGSASAEVIADIALCPFEAVKVRVQTQPGFARGLADGLPKFVRSEGALGLYKGLVPLWGRQIPYTMMKFASFETIVELIYKHAIPTPKNECSKNLQLGVSFAGGYVAGVFCAVVSHPADNLVSFLNNAKGATVGDAVKKLGLWGLFTRGLPLRIVMIGTLTGAQWGIYDAFKVLLACQQLVVSLQHRRLKLQRRRVKILMEYKLLVGTFYKGG